MTVKHLTASATALLLLSASTARAQAPSTTTTTTTTTQTISTDTYRDSRNILSGSFGSSWAGDAEDGSWGFDGAYDYLYNDIVGFEFIGAYTPDFSLSPFPSLDDTKVGSFMFNAVTALPLGTDANWLPFLSGGLGMFTIRNDRNKLDIGTELGLDLDDVQDSELRDNQFGGNIGVGIMGFADQVGFRADARYYSGLGNNEGDREFVAQTFRDISYWRTTAGISFRW